MSWSRGGICGTEIEYQLLASLAHVTCHEDELAPPDAGRVAAGCATMAASFDVAFKRSPIKTLHSAITTPTGVVEAQSVGFSFYSAAEVRKISVVQVHTAEQRDAHNRPLPGGLYDPAMGPTDQYESCKTCGLDYTTCPGHLGHIELALPAYTPVLFPQLVTLLRSTCLLCHRLKADAGKLRIEGSDYPVKDGDVFHFRFNV